METTILAAAERVFSRLEGSELSTRNIGLYLTSSEYATSKPVNLANNTDDDNTLAILIEAALAADDVTLFNALYDEVGYARFLYVFADYFGLSAFFIYSATSCLAYYLDAQLEDPEAWADLCDEYLFDSIEEDLWELSWSPTYHNQPLAILNLLHFKGGISATSLLKKCIMHGFSAFYAPLVAIGARFEVDDLYLADHPLTDLRTLLDEGLLDTFKASATSEDWACLTQTFIDLTYPDDDSDSDDE